jgi:hypothetical protein
MSARRKLVSIRLTPPQQSLITDLAQRLNVTNYQAGIRIFESGLATLFGNEPTKAIDDNLVLLADILARLEALERLTDRAVFAATTSYVYAAFAVHGSASNSEALNASLSEASLEAYRRQLEIARGGQ